MDKAVYKYVIFGLRPNYRAVIYIVATIFLSQLCDLSTNSKSYFANQNNALNLYFVKFSWGWTLLILGSCSIITVFKCKTNMKTTAIELIKILARLAIATLVWYCGTGLFLTIEEHTGVCGIPKYHDKVSCKKNGFFWNGFDISGHCFLLVWCNLVITEEVHKLFECKNVKGSNLNSFDTFEKTINDIQSNIVTLIFRSLSCLIVLWDLMIISTNIFFHTALEKLLGTLIAIIFWIFTYKLIYRHVHKQVIKYIEI